MSDHLTGSALRLAALFFLLLCPGPARGALQRSDALHISPDGRHFAASFDSNLNIGVISGGEKKFVKAIAFGDQFNWFFLGFTPDSKRLAVAFFREEAVRYYSVDGKYLGETAGLVPLAVSPGFRWAADQKDGAERASVGPLSGERFTPRYTLPADVTAAAFSPGDALAAVAVYRPKTKEAQGAGYLTLLSLKSGKYSRKYTPPQLSRIDLPAFSPDGAYLSFADGDGKVPLVRLSDWKFVGSVFKPGNSVYAVKFSPDGSMLAVAYSGGLRVYSVPACSLLLKRDFDGVSDTDWSIRDLAFAKDGSFLAALVWTKAANKGKGGSSVKFVEIRRPRP